ncbi:MAG: cytidine deaminase [Bacteroidaceae bacterium]|nr:cytidine deaminase [Bacteroidaceae bacterium]
MREYKVTCRITVYQMDELSAADRELVNAACEATKSSYAPYSHFRVGAAARLSDGTIFAGSNQEAAAFPSGMCAERTVLYAAQAQHPDKKVVALAIAAQTGGHFLDDPITPCGACRQVILEAEDRGKCDIRILLHGTKGIHVIGNARELLPLHFTSDNLK